MNPSAARLIRKPDRSFLVVGAFMLVLAVACVPVDDPSRTTTTEPVPPSTQVDNELADTSSSSPATSRSMPPDPEAGSEPANNQSALSPPTPSVEPDSTGRPRAPTRVDEGGLDELSADARLLIHDWRTAVSVSIGVWPGYDLASIPAVLAVIDSEGVVGAVVAFNHPNPHALGAPIHSLEIDGHEILVIGEVAEPDRLVAWAPFDLFADVGGTDTFVMISREGEPGFELNNPFFVVLIVHEAFHRHQIEEWAASATVQYLDSYDYSAANLELALLENRILIAAYRAEVPTDLERLAHQFAAVRAVRHQRDHRIAHDEEQERLEGSAQWIEHRIGEPIGYLYTSNNHTQDLHSYNEGLSDPEALFGGIKDFFSLKRFYNTGATLLWLLDRLGMSDVIQQLKEGKTPAVLLEEHLAPLGNLDELVAGALADHDPENRLGVVSATLAGMALDEPSIGDGNQTLSPITDAELACLADHGVEVADGMIIPERVARECFSE